MNIYQRIILILGSGSLILVLLTAPKYVILEGSKIDYSIILNKLEDAKVNPPKTYQDGLAIAKMSISSPSIDLPKTCLRMAVVVAVTVLLCFAFSKLGNPHVKKPIVRFFKWISFSFAKLFYFFRIHKGIFFSFVAIFIIVMVLIFISTKENLDNIFNVTQQKKEKNGQLKWLTESKLNTVYDYLNKANKIPYQPLKEDYYKIIAEELADYTGDPEMDSLIKEFTQSGLPYTRIVPNILHALQSEVQKSQKPSLWQYIAQRVRAMVKEDIPAEKQ